MTKDLQLILVAYEQLSSFARARVPVCLCVCEIPLFFFFHFRLEGPCLLTEINKSAGLCLTRCSAALFRVLRLVFNETTGICSGSSGDSGGRARPLPAEGGQERVGTT